MAIDPRIVLGAQTPNAVNPLLQGFAAGQQIRQAPIQNQLLQANLESRQLQNEQTQQTLSDQDKLMAGQSLSRAFQRVKPQLAAGDTVGALKALGSEYDNVADNPVAASAIQDAMQAIGSGDPQAIQRVMRDGEIIAKQFPLTATTGASNKAFAPVPLTDEDGKFAGYGIPSFDPNTGQATLTPIQAGEGRDFADPASLARSKSFASKSGELDARSGKEPALQGDIAAAKKKAEAAVEQQVKQQGQKRKIEDADAIYQSLANSDLSLIYGKGESLWPDLLRSQKGIDLMAQKNQLVGMLELAAAGELKGQGTITDNERQTLKDAATVLNNPNISPTLARQQLDAAMRVIYGNAGEEFGTKNTFIINGNQYRKGDTLNFNGQTIRILGGDPADPDIEVLQ